MEKSQQVWIISGRWKKTAKTKDLKARMLGTKSLKVLANDCKVERSARGNKRSVVMNFARECSAAGQKLSAVYCLLQK